MESTSQDKKATHVITIQPNETVLTAFPYRPHSSLLDFLKGEPRVLGATQILLALIIVGLGTIFVLNYIHFSQRLPLVLLSGYPFWGALIFMVTGYLTAVEEKSKTQGQGVMAMNVISSLVAITGITFTILSYRHEDKYCQTPSLEETCVLGRTLFIGILSILLIISIAELSISVTIASFRSKCWTQSDEVLFFLPLDVTQNSEQPAPEENAQLQFVLQEEFSSDDSTTNAQPVFFGGYAFFKLRLSRSPLVSQPDNKDRRSVTDEQKQSILSAPKFSEEEMPIQPDSTFKQMTDEDLQSAMIQPSQMETQLMENQAVSLQVTSHSVLKLQDLSPEDLPSQALPVQGLSEQSTPAKSTSSDVKQSYNLTANDLSPQGILSQDMLLHDMASKDMQSLSILSQDTLSHNVSPQDIPSQDMLSQAVSEQAILPEASTSHIVQVPKIQHLLQQPPDLRPENIHPQNQQNLQMSYQDIRSEVMEETKEWKAEEELHRRKSSRRHSLNQQTKGLQYIRRYSLYMQTKGQQSPKRHSLDQQSKGWQSPKRKSLDQQIKDWLSPKRHSIDKQAQLNQTTEQLPDQQAEDRQAKGEQYPEGQSKDEQVKDQQTDKEQHSKKQTKDQQAEDQQAQEKKSPKGWYQSVQPEGQQAQVEKMPKQLCQDSESQIQQYQFWQYHKSNLQTGQPKTVNPMTGELKAGETNITKHENGNLQCSPGKHKIC
ncbi:LOW QUALITY PROTEIN: membrane-spanning 4-domains subfamily A member 14 [Cebus imitator]|uniref:LOW QUALITY PROTEIN: membrane-spanning 4-domains subfamily A member 14 n=1 Tax=Cebus imitator TaxID=2715852 RepID=UPI00080A0090|nr:LOW QUALITY PROTEIN: membrane-spanning 4-domains subfamily A member 14 [Cebus imitator]